MEEEYEIRHYGFSVAQLKQETKDMIQYDIESACNKFVKCISTNPLIDGEIASEIEQEKKNLSKEIADLFKDSFAKIENIISENFTIPMNVTLSQSDQQQLKMLDENEEQLQKTLDQRMQSFLRFEQSMATLNEELNSFTDHEHLLDVQQKVVEAVELSLSTPSNLTYLVDLAANSAKLKK